ncbi:MAG: flagellar basal body-associated protein FliL [Burkholderiales bacterium]|nr:flagellar basal body-associated protein FliL [Burkholderiales bacterium]
MANADPKSSDADASAGKKPAWKKWLPIALLVLVGAAAAGGWFYWKRSADKEPHAEAQAAAPQPPVFQPLEPFTVNLNGDGLFLQTALTLQLGSQKDVEHLKLYLPQVRSRLLMLISAKTGEEISSTEGKQQLIEEIMSSVRQPFAPGLPEIQISNVFITSFVIQ